MHTFPFAAGHRKKKKHTADRDNNGTVDVEEYATWFSAFYFSEEMALDKADRVVCNLARKYDLSVVDTDRYKHTFDEFDTNGSGLIEFNEFKELLQELLKTIPGAGLPNERLRKYGAGNAITKVKD